MDWTDLTNYLGTNAGGQLKSMTNWQAPNIGATDQSGFSALPGVFRSGTGNSSSIIYSAYFWSSTENVLDNTKAWYRDLGFSYGNINPHCASTRGNACIHKAVGLSEFLFVYYRFYFGEGSLLDAKGVKQLL